MAQLDPEHQGKRRAVDDFLGEVLSRPEISTLGLGNVFTEYTSDAVRSRRKPARRTRFGVTRCGTCSATHDRSLIRCPVCGTQVQERPLSRAA